MTYAALEEAREACLRGDYEVAYSIYQQLLAMEPHNGKALLDYGRAKLREDKHPEEAAALLEQAVDILPDSYEALVALGEACSSGYGGGYSRAANLYRRAIKLQPSRLDAYVGLGMLMRSPGHPVSDEDAIGAFRQAVRLAPSHPDAYLDLGTALLRAGHIEGAVPMLNTAQRLYQRDGKTAASDAMRALTEQINRGEHVTKFVTIDFAIRWPHKGQV